MFKIGKKVGKFFLLTSELCWKNVLKLEKNVQVSNFPVLVQCPKIRKKCTSVKFGLFCTIVKSRFLNIVQRR